MDLKNIQDYTIKPLLRTIPGVAEVNSWGGLVQQFHVDADPARLAGYGLTLEDLAGTLRDNNANSSGHREPGERFIRGWGGCRTN
jgi:cobalt-zinc-cadmium resistance protein CzcA